MQKTPKIIRKLLLWIGCVCVAAFLLSAGYSGYSAHVEAERERVIRNSIRENLPLGSTPQAVIAFLTSRHIEHAPYDPKERRIGAIVRGIWQEPGFETEEEIDFDFTDTGLLKAFHFRDVYNGL